MSISGPSALFASRVDCPRGLIYHFEGECFIGTTTGPGGVSYIAKIEVPQDSKKDLPGYWIDVQSLVSTSFKCPRVIHLQGTLLYPGVRRTDIEV